MLFKHFESLTHLYDNLEHVLKLKLRSPGFVVGQLRDHKESALLARKLTAIFCDMPIQVELDHLQRAAPDLSHLHELYESANFGPLLRYQAERIARSLS